MTVSDALCTCDRCAPASADGLVRRPIEAVASAIANECPGIVYDRSRLRGITVELTVANGGAAIAGELYIQRTARVRHIAGPMPPPPAAEREA
jgi:hypothetical protein